MKRLLALVLPLLVLSGCGGLPVPGGERTDYYVTPEKAGVAPGGTVDLTPSASGVGFASVDAAVREGAAGGSVVRVATGGELTYTAPDATGTYHVDVTFRDGSGRGKAKRTATIAVAVAP